MPVSKEDTLALPSTAAQELTSNVAVELLARLKKQYSTEESVNG